MMDYLIGVLVLVGILIYLVLKAVAIRLFSVDIIMEKIEREHAGKVLEHAERRRQ